LGVGALLSPDLRGGQTLGRCGSGGGRALLLRVELLGHRPDASLRSLLGGNGALGRLGAVALRGWRADLGGRERLLERPPGLFGLLDEGAELLLGRPEIGVDAKREAAQLYHERLRTELYAAVTPRSRPRVLERAWRVA
jgi:hypothetical protein